MKKLLAALCAAALLTLAGGSAQAIDADQLKAQAGSWLAAPQMERRRPKRFRTLKW